uniref:MARVEL domain-containing protein n=1 Tax=Syphacia muris TaxID=451379 RepID=A0A0N5AVF0_9BILA
MLCFVTLLLIGRTVHFSGTFWSLIVCSTAITASLTMLILYLFHVVDILVQIPWILSEMIFCFCWSIFYFIVGSVLAITSSTYKHFGFGFAALCAFGAMSIYGFDCFLKFLSWKHDEVAHGGKDNQIYVNTVNPPSNRNP